MSDRGLPARLLLGLAALTTAAVAVVGGLALRPPGLLAVGLASVVTACLAGGVARESANEPGTAPGRSPLEAAWRAGAVTIGLLLFLSGTAALGGPVLTVLAGAVLAVGGLGLWLLHAGRPPRRNATMVTPPPTSAGRTPPPAPRPVTGPRPAEAGGTVTYLPPVATVSTAALGREWVGTTTALAGQLHPSARQSIVRRRHEVLDELERRDPDGFARWLTEGSLSSDPARYLGGGPAAA